MAISYKDNQVMGLNGYVKEKIVFDDDNDDGGWAAVGGRDK